MGRLLAAAFFSILIVLVTSCSTSAPTPTAAPAPKPTEQTKVSAATPTAVATSQPVVSTSKQVDFPGKGKTITIIVPFPAGGTTDLAARLLATFMEKDLGTQVQVVDKPGAGSQTGLTEFAKSKPDGYTLAYFILQNAITSYLDPERKAAFGRKDFIPIALVGEDPKLVAVKADSPYKTLKDLLDAAKAAPGKMTFGAGGVLSPEHVWGLQLQQAANVKFSTVQFEGIAPTMIALLGGHVDFVTGSMGALMGPMKEKQIRILTIADREPTPLAPEVPTIDSLGYKVHCLLSFAVAVPANTPKEIVDVLSKSVEKVMNDPEHKKKRQEMFMDFRYSNGERTAAYWDELEKETAPFISLAKQQ